MTNLEIAALWHQLGYAEWEQRINEMAEGADAETERASLCWSWECDLGEQESLHWRSLHFDSLDLAE